MVDHVLNARGDNVQWGGFLLDRYVAPKCSALAKCLAPEVPELPNYFGSYFLNNIFTATTSDNTRSLTFVFLRRLTNAVRDYRKGREEMLACVAARPCSNDMVRAYLRALSYFETSAVNTYLALKAHDAVGKSIDPTAPPAFNPGDGSPSQRLNAVYNALKHFEDNVEKGHVPPDVSAPIWLVDDGIECVGSEGEAKLHFEELIEIQRELEKDARFLSEDVYRLAQERAAKTKSGES
jgi:hypothetical protein